jgi:hypothetical protein
MDANLARRLNVAANRSNERGKHGVGTNRNTMGSMTQEISYYVGQSLVVVATSTTGLHDQTYLEYSEQLAQSDE